MKKWLSYITHCIYWNEESSMSFSQPDDILIKEQSTSPLPDFGVVGVAVDDDTDEDETTSVDVRKVDHPTTTSMNQPTTLPPRVLDRKHRKQILEKINVISNNGKGKKIEDSGFKKMTTATTKVTSNAFASLEELLGSSSTSSSTSFHIESAPTKKMIPEPVLETLGANTMPKPNQDVHTDENCDPNTIQCRQDNQSSQPSIRLSLKSKNPKNRGGYDRKPIRVVHQNSKSIVGSRPQHWEIPQKSTLRRRGQQQQQRQQQPAFSTPFLQPNLTKRKAAMAAELSRAKQQRRLFHQQREIQKDHFVPSSSSKDTAESEENTMDTANTTKTTNTATNTATKISFVPSFLAKPNRATPADPVTALLLLDDTNSTSPPTPSDFTTISSFHERRSSWQQQPPSLHGSWNSPILCTPTTTRKTAGAAGGGALGKRLKAIRDQMHGDRIRFQSGQYPFTARPLHCNDPRYRAQSAADVTIVGSPVFDQHHANTDPQQQNHLVLVRGYVHHWNQRSRDNNNNNNNNPNNQDNDDDGFRLWFPGHCYAWIAFPYETAKEQTVVSGVSLRIYNAMPVRLYGTTKSNCSNHDNDDEWMLLCTQLCEPYPSSVLPALEPPPPPHGANLSENT
jgi:hypothetical protein